MRSHIIDSQLSIDAVLLLLIQSGIETLSTGGLVLREHELIRGTCTAPSAFDLLVCLRVAWELKNGVILEVFCFAAMNSDPFLDDTTSW